MKNLLVVLALLLAGCGSRGERWERPLAPVGPVVAGDRLAWLVPGTSRVVVIDPAAGAPTSFPAGEVPRALAPAGDAVAVLGGPGDRPHLTRIALPSGDRTRIALPSAYDRLAVAPGGTRAVAFFDPTATPAPGSPAARNYNEVSVVDLVAGTAVPVSLETESLAPRGVVFPAAGDVAAVVLDAAVALVDLADPAVHVRIPLKLGGGAELTPEEALFAPDGAFLYVRTAESNDVLALEVRRGEGELGGSVNFLFAPGAGALEDLVVPAGPGFERSVAAVFRAGTGGLAALLDATGDASKTHVAALARPAGGIEDLGGGRLLLHPAPTATEAAEARAVAGWEPLADRLDEDLLPGRLASPPRVGGGAGIFVHDAVRLAGEGTVPALTVAALVDDGGRLRVRLTSVGLAGAPGPTAVDPATGLCLVGVEVERDGSGAAPAADGLTGSLVAVGPVGPGELPIGGAVLDARFAALGVAGGHVWALHDTSSGDLTLLPLDDLRRGAARRHDGFLLTGALEGKR